MNHCSQHTAAATWPVSADTFVRERWSSRARHGTSQPDPDPGKGTSKVRIGGACGVVAEGSFTI
jgi:hypothetical protein